MMGETPPVQMLIDVGSWLLGIFMGFALGWFSCKVAEKEKKKP